MRRRTEGHAERSAQGAAPLPAGTQAPLLYCVTIFTSAFLLFQVQPLVGKLILPWFGGTPAVWTTCLLFFQVLLLGGYAYAHLLAVWARPKLQGVIHAVLLAAALAAVLLAFPPTAQWKPTGEEHPAWRILLLLTVTVGLPYLLLASTGPLVQSWFSQTERGASPYRLYALSNVGSLLALISYPFVFERAFSLRVQSIAWSGGYAVFVLASGLCARRMFASNRPAPRQSDAAADKTEPPPSAGQIVLWLLLAMVGSLMLLATTNQLCQDVPVIPFLWVLPLSLYLLTFIIAFDRPRLYSRVHFTPLLAISSALGLLVLYQGAETFAFLVAGYCVWMFVSCMICHGELVHLKPAPRYLTHFYLAVALGGALGGVFVSVVAPLVFNGNWEFHLAAFATPALLLVLAMREGVNNRATAGERRSFVAAAALCLGMLGAALVWHVVTVNKNAVLMTRNFYGVLRLVQHEDHLTITHGHTIHGMQFSDPELADAATSYYSPAAGVGLAMRHHPRHLRGRGLHVGVIGLGAGSLAVYAGERDVFEFYEINPAVIQLAQSHFTYLANAEQRGARIELHQGDARLLLERELTASHELRLKFDVLVVDAFSSDAIPIHLLTEECFDLYWQHLAPGGVLAVHISNRFLDLAPVVHTLAKRAGRPAFQIQHRAPEDQPHVSSSRWVLITTNLNLLKQAEFQTAVTPWPDDLREIVWTDDYSNLFQVLD